MIDRNRQTNMAAQEKWHNQILVIERRFDRGFIYENVANVYRNRQDRCLKAVTF